ncbi:OLC1v1011927C1 [Oldenlandia corymbosa var. corymbosa]|uniref:OLC1v1011927C1 n=1 Tax=Oldenlandia corymbosa var. corymbosa TaxID=529605 RepID=A0AAV1DY04_OLDCO|nr:OLC1v1011927C1 [Oldenlandia corymbosa var. corymbosa]
MAADQRKRRLNSSTFVGCSFREQREQFHSKRKKSGPPRDDLNVRYNISLEWDDKNKSVVAKKEQIGILRRDLVPFVDAGSHSYESLADIITVPNETFELKDFAGVLSYEVWCSHISDAERNLLTQYLPGGVEPDEAVKELLSGDNFHFGNPFLKWGSSLCSGKLHPDDILMQEQQIKANRNTYFSELHKYHNDMIESLQRWKDTFDKCKDSDEEILHNICKSRKQIEVRMHLHSTVTHDPVDDGVATPDSSSWATSERACSNYNNVHISGDSQGRKVFSDSNVNNLSDSSKVAVMSKKGEKVQKRNIQLGDGAKYMSYIKVSKEQHRRIKRTMKHTSNSIQHRSLNNVLGNLDTLHVQPFEVFEEEERQKLHDYWFQLANKDVPAGFANWTERKSQVKKLVKSVCQELEETLKVQIEDGENDSTINLSSAKLIDSVEPSLSPISSAQEVDTLDITNNELEVQLANEVGYEVMAASVETGEEKTAEDIHDGRTSYHGADSLERDVGSESSDTCSAEEDYDAEKVELINCGLHSDMSVEPRDNIITAKAVDPALILSDYSGNTNHMDMDIPASVTQGNRCDSSDEVWSAVGVPGSFYHPHPAGLGHQYSSSGDFSLDQTQAMSGGQVGQGQGTRRELLDGQLDDLSVYGSFTNNQQQGALQEKNDGKKQQLHHRQPENSSFFGGFPSQDRSESLESLFKVHGGGLPYHPQEQKRMGLEFHEPDNLMLENGHLILSDFKDQVDLPLPPEMRQKRVNDMYGENNIQNCEYHPSDGRYSITKQQLPPPVDVGENWGVGSVRGLVVPSESHLNDGGGLLSHQSWYTGENRGRVGGWSGMESGGGFSRSSSVGYQNNLDQSLFSVLSECSGMRCVMTGPVPAASTPNPSSLPYGSMGNATERVLQTSEVYTGGGATLMSSGDNILQHSSIDHSPLVYLSRHEVSVGVVAGRRNNNNLDWVSVAHHQNSGYLRSWNQ